MGAAREAEEARCRKRGLAGGLVDRGGHAAARLVDDEGWSPKLATAGLFTHVTICPR